MAVYALFTCCLRIYHASLNPLHFRGFFPQASRFASGIIVEDGASASTYLQCCKLAEFARVSRAIYVLIRPISTCTEIRQIQMLKGKNCTDSSQFIKQYDDEQSGTRSPMASAD
jgi:hypothetical protein